MTEKEFQTKYLEKVRQTLKFALENKYSNFYRQKYAGLDIKPENIKTYADFQKIPLLTKDEILATPLSKRTFCSENEITGYNVSSGTVNINLPLILPKIETELSPYSQNGFLKKIGAKKVLMILPISVSQNMIKNIRLPHLAVDPLKPALNAKIAKTFEPDAIVSTPTLLYLFIDYLKKEGFDFKKIKAVIVSSEYITKQKADYFKKIFSGAIVHPSYGSSELGGIVGFRCGFLDKKEPSLFHLLEKNLMELIGAEDGNFEELVCTSLEKNAFPLIRYRTGDVAEKTNLKCSKDGNEVYRLKGKSSLDILRVSGALLHTQMIANAIAVLGDAFRQDFQMEVSEKTVDGRIYTKLVLKIIPTNAKANDNLHIARIVQDNLYLSAGKTMTDFVNEKIFLPLEIEFVNELEKTAKSRNIISHLN